MAKRGEIRGKSIRARRKDIDKWRASPHPKHAFTFEQKPYRPSMRPSFERETINVDKKPDDDSKSAFLANLRGDASTMRSDLLGPVKEFGPVKNFTTMVGDVGGMFKFPPGLMGLIPALGIS